MAKTLNISKNSSIALLKVVATCLCPFAIFRKLPGPLSADKKNFDKT